jgi:hypothetical protein
MKNDREEMEKHLVERAQKLGLSCQVNSQGKWVISSENWQLIEEEKQWLLSVKTTPQIKLTEWEAVSFLKRQWQRKFKNQEENKPLFPSARRGY